MDGIPFDGFFGCAILAELTTSEAEATHPRAIFGCAALAAPYNIIHFKLFKKSSKIKQVKSLN